MKPGQFKKVTDPAGKTVLVPSLRGMKQERVIPDKTKFDSAKRKDWKKGLPGAIRASVLRILAEVDISKLTEEDRKVFLEAQKIMESNRKQIMDILNRTEGEVAKMLMKKEATVTHLFNPESVKRNPDLFHDQESHQKLVKHFEDNEKAYKNYVEEKLKDFKVTGIHVSQVKSMGKNDPHTVAVTGEGQVNVSVLHALSSQAKVAADEGKKLVIYMQLPLDLKNKRASVSSVLRRFAIKIEESEDDCFVRDVSRGGYDVSCEGKAIKHCKDMDEALKTVKDWKTKNKFNPTTWFESDHGNKWPIDDEGNEIK